MRIKAQKKYLKKIGIIGIIAILLTGTLSFPCSATGQTTNISGKVYRFDKDSHYEFSSSKKYKSSDKAVTYGTFSISGEISNVTEKEGVPAYEVSNGNLDIYYKYSDKMLKADEKSWHLVDDNTKKVNNEKLDEKIKKGALILQTSKDRTNWVTVKSMTNVFEQEKVRSGSVYTTQEMQILNGCFYRFIVAYEIRKMVDPNKFLFVSFKEYKYNKTAEVYEFYAYSSLTENTHTTDQTHSLGDTVRTKEFDGYFQETTMEKSDPHYGWKLGHFFVSGYTDKKKNPDGDMVFLKNVGDKVTLWFKLEQDIKALHKNENLYISADAEGYDKYFQTERTNFGKGTLIVRYTDYNNNTSKPQIYTNYLEAQASVGADTQVQLFEEGDYEVALDYEITSDQLIDKVSHYRIFFKFSVRNGNCMVYPFDIKTGNELTTSSMTENGFRLDLAKSRYLTVIVKREILAESLDGLVEDTRFNGPAKDGEEYTDEGIYTITVSNKITNQETIKKIYVGDNKVLKAHLTTGYSIPEINELVSQGAIIDDDGVIERENDMEAKMESSGKFLEMPIIVGILGSVLVIIVILFVCIKYKKIWQMNGETDTDEGEQP